MKAGTYNVTDHWFRAKDVAWMGRYCLIIAPFYDESEPEPKVPYILTNHVLVPLLDPVTPLPVAVPLISNVYSTEGFYAFHGKVCHF